MRSLATSSEAVNRGSSSCSARISADHESSASTAPRPARASVSVTIVRTGNHSSTTDSTNPISTWIPAERPS